MPEGWKSSAGKGHRPPGVFQQLRRASDLQEDLGGHSGFS
jgi:hypothetical protein